MLERSSESSINRIPWPILQPLGFTVGGKIYLRTSLYKDYISGNPKPQTLAIITHEQTHITRLGKSIKIYFKFWSDPAFRLQEEFEAISEEMKILKKYRADFKVDERAKDLASFAYLWCTNYDNAKKELEKIWDSIN